MIHLSENARRNVHGAVAGISTLTAMTSTQLSFINLRAGDKCLDANLEIASRPWSISSVIRDCAEQKIYHAGNWTMPPSSYPLIDGANEAAKPFTELPPRADVHQTQAAILATANNFGELGSRQINTAYDAGMTALVSGAIVLAYATRVLRRAFFD